MSTRRKNPRSETPFLWIPGQGLDAESVLRMREQFRRPRAPMGEAWFMGEERHMFEELLGGLDALDLEQLRRPLEEITSGNSSFGPMDEWTHWYRYLLAQLVTRHAENSFDSLYQHLVAAFIALHPRGIDGPYAGFADDAMQTLGRCLMDPSRWTDGRLATSAPEDPRSGGRAEALEWSVACGDFSAGMFFCAAYLPEEELPAWLDSAFAIDCPLWITQLFVWLLGTYPILSGQMQQIGDLEFDPATHVAWLGSNFLEGDFSGIYAPEPTPIPIFSPARRNAILAAVGRNVTEARYFAWLDAIKPYEYLECELADKPSRFAEVFHIA